MIMLVSAIIGAIFGGLKAKKRQGTGLDIAQYAGVYALVFALISLAVTVIFMRLES